MHEIREALFRILGNAKDDSLLPHQLADILVRLTGLYPSIVQEVTASDIAFKAVLLAELQQEQAASRARIKAENSEAYRRWRGAKDLESICVEAIRTYKKVLQTKSEEKRQAYH